MKAGNRFIKNIKTKWRNESIIFLFAAIYAMIAILLNGVMLATDTYTYLDAWEVFRNGGIDYLRTPVLPIVLGCLKALFGENLWGGVFVALQLSVLFLSIHCFYGMASRFLRSETLAFWLTLIYAVISVTWVVFVLTEIFAISLVVFLLYYTIELYGGFSLRSAAGFGGMLLLLIFLRPAMIYLLPVFMVWWVLVAIMRKRRRIAAAAGLAAVLVTSSAVLLYMRAFEREHGRFMITAVSMINQIECAKLYISHKEDNIDNEVLRHELNEGNADTLAGSSDSVEVSLNKTYDDLMGYYRQNPLVFVKSVGSRLYRYRNVPLFNVFISSLATVCDMFMPRLPTLYMFLMLYMLILVCIMIRHRMIPLLSVLIWALAMSHVFVTVVGAQYDFERLLLPAWPMVLLLFGQICARFRKRRSICMVTVED